MAPQTVNETDEERQEREWAEQEATRKERYAEAAAFEPNVGVVVYRSQSDPFAEKRGLCSIALTITKRTTTRFTVEDGTQYKLATGRYQSNVRNNYMSDGDPIWEAREYGRGYSGITVYAKPTETVVYTKAEYDTKLREQSQAAIDKQDADRRAKLAELGVSGYVKSIIETDYQNYSGMRALQALLDTDEQKVELFEAVFEVALRSTSALKRLRQRIEHLSAEWTL